MVGIEKIASESPAQGTAQKPGSGLLKQVTDYLNKQGLSYGVGKFPPEAARTEDYNRIEIFVQNEDTPNVHQTLGTLTRAAILNNKQSYNQLYDHVEDCLFCGRDLPVFWKYVNPKSLNGRMPEHLTEPFTFRIEAPEYPAIYLNFSAEKSPKKKTA